MRFQLKNALLVTLLLLVFNTIQMFSFYITRMYENLNFFNLNDHIAVLIYAIGSFLCVILMWKWVGKINFLNRFRFVFTFIFSTIAFACYSSIIHVLMRAKYGYSTSWEMLPGNIVFTFSIVHLYISGLTIAYLYFTKTKQLSKSLEIIEKDKQLLNASLLQKNLEPHFLFNNLSVLSSFVDDKDEARAFINEFASVYRYFLKNANNTVVSLDEEIDFCKKYFFLVQKRFGDLYILKNELPINKKAYLPPSAVQNCIENALKHNEASSDEPIVITLRQADSYLIVSNNCVPKEFVQSNKTGIENLKSRYALVTDRPIKIESSKEFYNIYLPLIELVEQ